MIVCECGEIIEGNTFRDYIKTSAGPSTQTIGHKECGYVFDFIDGEAQKKYSTRKELKSMAMKFAEINNLDGGDTARLLIEVDRMKSCGKLSDSDILIKASHKL